jgi:hypothetical protein
VAYVPEGEAEEILLRVAEHLAQGAVDLDEAPVEVVEGHADGGVVERAAEELLALPERLLGPLPLGDVAGRGEDQVPPAVVHGAHVHLDGEGRAVLAAVLSPRWMPATLPGSPERARSQSVGPSPSAALSG